MDNLIRHLVEEMAGNTSLFHFDNAVEPKALQQSLTPTLARSHPYDAPSVPKDILQFIPPNGNPFSLYGDPYAQMVFIMSERNVIRRSQYWLQQREADNSYTELEVSLLSFLSKHRCATSAQIYSAVFPPATSKAKARDFIKRCVDAGILIPFSWQSPVGYKDPAIQRKRPRIYGLSPAACKAAQQLLNLRGLPRSFKFIPIQFQDGHNPLMGDIFNTLIANELYCRLQELDRVIDWQVGTKVLLPNSDEFRTQFVVKVIKDVQEFRTLWIEVIRPKSNWYSQTITRFQALQKAISLLEPADRPDRVILIIDDDSRFEDITNLAAKFMPNVVYLLTTDERLLAEWGKESLALYSVEHQEIVPAEVPFLKKDYPGMTASKYRSSYQVLDNDMFDDDF